MSPLNIIHHSTAAGPVLHVVGELDHEQAAVLRDHVDGLVLSPGQSLLIDLSRLEFCDSTGISVLLAARHRALAADAELILTGIPANTMRILRIVGLDQVFTIRTATERGRGGEASARS
ncbi:MAG: STAS domain-containing protein [Streptomyces sp.]